MAMMHKRDKPALYIIIREDGRREIITNRQAFFKRQAELEKTGEKIKTELQEKVKA